MNESELRELFFRIGARCNIEQYRMLKRCSKKKDMIEWNKWREDNPKGEIWLSGVSLSWANLEGADLRDAHLEVANLWETHLEGAELAEAHLESAHLTSAHLEGADLREAHLEGAVLVLAYLKDANLEVAYLGGANLWLAHLEGAYLRGAYLEGAGLIETHLEGARLRNAYLQRAKFDAATVNGNTLIWDCSIDKETDFTGVGLDTARVEPGLKQLLQYNIRLKRWREWYKQHRLLTPLVWLFWQMSDYGRSTGRVICTFFVLALLFAGIYYACGLIWYPGIVANLFEDQHGPIPAWLVPFRAVYFSIVTMTTLGFGDMHANARDLCGHVLLTLQVLLGYVLLGALITRFAVLFTAGGPAAKFAGKKKTRGGD